MLKRIKLQSFKNQINNNLEQRDISRRNSKLKQLGFLINESYFNDFEYLFSLGNELGLQEKDIKVFSFIEARRKIPSLRHNQITNKEFNSRGDIRNQNAEEFLNFPFDVLICIYEGSHKYLDVMVSKSNANFKVGFKDLDHRLYDLLLNVDPENKSILNNEIKKYLKIFNKI